MLMFPTAGGAAEITTTTKEASRGETPLCYTTLPEPITIASLVGIMPNDQDTGDVSKKTKTKSIDNTKTTASVHKSDGASPSATPDSVIGSNSNTNQTQATSKAAVVDVPQTQDVLCATSSSAYSRHPGNRRYTVLIQLYRHTYQTTTQRDEKSRITRQVIQAVQDYGGRFLKYNVETQSFVELDDHAKREKVGHALRIAVDPAKRRRRPRGEDGLLMGNVGGSGMATMGVINAPFPPDFAVSGGEETGRGGTGRTRTVDKGTTARDKKVPPLFSPLAKQEQGRPQDMNHYQSMRGSLSAASAAVASTPATGGTAADTTMTGRGHQQQGTNTTSSVPSYHSFLEEDAGMMFPQQQRQERMLPLLYGPPGTRQKTGYSQDHEQNRSWTRSDQHVQHESLTDAQSHASWSSREENQMYANFARRLGDDSSFSFVSTSQFLPQKTSSAMATPTTNSIRFSEHSTSNIQARTSTPTPKSPPFLHQHHSLTLEMPDDMPDERRERNNNDDENQKHESNEDEDEDDDTLWDMAKEISDEF